MEVPAIEAGTLTEIRYQVGETAKVGEVVAVIGGAGGASSSPAPKPAAAKPAPAKPAPAPAAAAPKAPAAPAPVAAQPSQSRDFAYPNMQPWREVRTPERNYGPARTAGGGHVTPLARRLAAERGIDLSQLKGSGPHGRVVARDIETAAPARGGIATGPSAAQIKALFQNVEHEAVPLDGMRATIARRLVEAKQTVPHFYLTTDLDIGRLMAMREDANAAAPKDASGNPAFKLSLNDFIIKAWAAALVRTPAANAVWAEDSILRFAHADIGIAVALEGGLMTPVIRNADTKAVTAISAEMRDLAERARAKKLMPAEYQGGASAISNLGMYGVREFAAIINPPHATILAVGTTRRAPVESEDGSVKFVSQMTVTLSCDHRVVDGALGAQLLATFKSLVEKPVTILV
jgi:pyruvate dehydrogenase E2 component (dihydrolipoamide acetyltransferase)